MQADRKYISQGRRDRSKQSFEPAVNTPYLLFLTGSKAAESRYNKRHADSLDGGAESGRENQARLK